MNAHSGEIVPISRLFFDDAGPHVITTGVPPRSATTGKLTPARGQELHNLLGASIAQLGGVSRESRRKTPAAPVLIPIESLCYGGRAALDRALEIRAEARATGMLPPGETIEELLDLIALAAE